MTLVRIKQIISNGNGFLKGNSLKAKSARGTVSLSIGAFFERILRLARTMILTRILLPSDFGLMSIISVIVMGFEAFFEVGVKQAIIQSKRGAEPEYLKTAWLFQAIRGGGLFVIAAVVSPLISYFYGKPELTVLIQVTSISILIRGLISPYVYVLEKEYKFSKAVLINQGSAVIGSIVTIIIAVVTRNVWALVLGSVAEVALLGLLSYLIVPFVPSLKISKDSFRELMTFAKGMFGLPLLTLVAFSADVLILGKVVTSEQLGMYSLALSLAQMPVFIFSKVINPVLLPAFSEKQDDRESLTSAVLKVTKLAATVSLPLIAFMVVCARGILQVIYGSEYAAVAIPFAILSFLVITQAEAQIMASLYLALGKPNLHRRFVILRVTIIVAMMYPAVLYAGLAGAATVVLAGNMVALLGQIYWSRLIINVRIYDYVLPCIPGAIIGGAILLAAGLVRLLITNSTMTFLVVCTILYPVIFIAGLYLMIGQGVFPTLCSRPVASGMPEDVS
jgi:O-antigen/teichoic acid export membrane protein